SGGAGTLRGTDGFRVRIRRLPGSEADVRVYIHHDRLRHPAQGLFGGGEGNLSRALLNDEDLTRGSGYLESGEVVLRSDGDVFTSDAAGGGGIGDPSA